MASAQPLASALRSRSNRLKGTSNNCHQSSGAPNLPANDSALFSFRFYAVHPKDVRDCQLRQLFEVPITFLTFSVMVSWDRRAADDVIEKRWFAECPIRVDCLPYFTRLRLGNSAA